jgi:hypothetical protein
MQTAPYLKRLSRLVDTVRTPLRTGADDKRVVAAVKKKLISIGSGRRGELTPFPYKTGRIYTVDSKWYFATREGHEQGPFSTKKSAETALAEFLALCLLEDFDGPETIQVSRQSEKVSHAEPAALDAMTNELLQYYRVREEQGADSAIQWARERTQLLSKPESAESIDHQQRRVEALEYIMEEERQGYVYIRLVHTKH